MNGPSLVLEKKIIVIILDLTGQSDIVLEQGYTLGLSLPFMIQARERGEGVPPNPVQSLHLLTVWFSLTLPSSYLALLSCLGWQTSDFSSETSSLATAPESWSDQDGWLSRVCLPV